MYKINATVNKDEKDWTKILTGYEIIFMEVTGVKRIEDIPADINETMRMCMHKFLNPRERLAMHLRYFGKLSYEKIGKRMNVNGERVRQITAKSIRKLRNSSCSKILRYGMKYYDGMMNIRKIQSEKITSEKVQELENHAINAIDHNDLERLIELKKEIQLYLNSQFGSGSVQCYEPDMPIDSLILSVRTYNCLKRAGYKTLGDLENEKYSKIIRIRNLGRKSFDELIVSCAEHGITLVDDIAN